MGNSCHNVTEFESFLKNILQSKICKGNCDPELTDLVPEYKGIFSKRDLTLIVIRRKNSLKMTKINLVVQLDPQVVYFLLTNQGVTIVEKYEEIYYTD